MQAKRLFIGVVMAMTTACTFREPVTCPSGRECPPGHICAANQDVCIASACGNALVEPAQGEACDDGNIRNGDGCTELCELEICGDGKTDPGELCDDGNNLSGDGCSADCHSTEICGNGIVDPGTDEMCDDGGKDSGDGCSATCKSEYCSNGNVDMELGEKCDDGNSVSGDGCSDDCRSNEICGNGIIDIDEQCDDGNTMPGGGCGPTCMDEVCGNGFVDPGEQCDDGNDNPEDDCGATCLRVECGNAFLDPNEQCDDGGTAAGDGCGPSCLREECGNGYQDPDEQCDDGNLAAGDNCGPTCLREECGNNVIDPGEECDGGNTTSGDGCGPTCLVERCGNQFVDPGEDCDDGNTAPGGGCGPTCLREECGNEFLDPGEECDDGNNGTDDGCGATCLREERGNNVIDPGEECDGGNIASGDGCGPTCQTERCGNGIIDPGEVCDDENAISGDGCSSACLPEVCGNGIFDPGEICDDGNTVAGDGCSPSCQLEACGNEIIDPGEDCDGENIPFPGESCSAECRFEICGNGILDPQEECDGEPILSAFCTDFGFDMGRLHCSDQCEMTDRHCMDYGWFPMRSGTAHHLEDVWGTGPDNVFAVGSGGTILHYDGVRWAPEDLGHLAGSSSFNLRGITGRSESQVFVVGDNGNRNAGIVLQYDGNTWSLMDISASAPRLEGVWTDLADEGDWEIKHFGTYAVGVNHTILKLPLGETTWQSVANDCRGDLRDIVGGHDSFFDRLFAVGSDFCLYDEDSDTGDNDGWFVPGWNDLHAQAESVISIQLGIFAVGGGNRYYHKFLENNNKWNAEPIAPGEVLYGIGRGPVSTIAVGAGGAIVRKIGENWEDQSIAGLGSDFRAVWSSGDNDVFAVGENGQIWHFGTTWSEVVPGEGQPERELNDVWDSVRNSRSRVIFAVGDNGTILREDGGAWSVLEPAVTTSNLHGIWGSGETAFAVGDAGVVLKYNGVQGWSPGAAPVSQALRAVWGSSTTNVLAVGDDGVIVRSTGGAWELVNAATPGDHRLNGIWGSGSSDIYAVGDSGALLHSSDGMSWTSRSSPTSESLRSVWASSPNDVFVISNNAQYRNNRIWHYDGDDWTEMPIPSHIRTLNKLMGSSSNNVFAVGDGGYVLHYDGVAWAPINTATDSAFQGMWVTSERAIFVGESSYVLTSFPVAPAAP